MSRADAFASWREYVPSEYPVDFLYASGQNPALFPWIPVVSTQSSTGEEPFASAHDYSVNMAVKQTAEKRNKSKKINVYGVRLPEMLALLFDVTAALFSKAGESTGNTANLLEATAAGLLLFSAVFDVYKSFLRFQVMREQLAYNRELLATLEPSNRPLPKIEYLKWEIKKCQQDIYRHSGKLAINVLKIVAAVSILFSAASPVGIITFALLADALYDGGWSIWKKHRTKQLANNPALKEYCDARQFKFWHEGVGDIALRVLAAVGVFLAVKEVLPIMTVLIAVVVVLGSAYLMGKMLSYHYHRSAKPNIDISEPPKGSNSDQQSIKNLVTQGIFPCATEGQVAAADKQQEVVTLPARNFEAAAG